MTSRERLRATAITRHQYNAANIAKQVEDPTRYGKVAHTSASAVKKNSFVRFTNPLKNLTDLTGFTVATRIYREDASDLTGTLLSFTDLTPANSNVAQRFFLNGNAGMHFQDDAAGTNAFDINTLNATGTNATNFIPAGKWVMVVLTVDATNGVSLYVDGAKKAHKNFTSTAGTASTAAAAAKLFDYQHVLSMVTNASYFSFAHGDANNGSAAARFDDLLIYNRALSDNDVRGLQTLANRKTDFTPEGVGIKDIEKRATSGEAKDIFDLSGRKMPAHVQLRRGLYIINGQKVYIR